MRRFFIFVLLLVASVWIGVELAQHPGYVLLVFKSLMVQMPIWFALLTLFLLIGTLYFILKVIDTCQFQWFKLKNWLRFRQGQRSYSKTQLGLTALIEGRFKKAEKLLLAGVDQTRDPLINYLAAAQAAHGLQAYARVDQYIQQAYRCAPHEEIAIGLTQASIEIAKNQWEQAAQRLKRLQELSPYYPRVLQLLEKVYVHCGDYEQLYQLLPALKKAGYLSQEQIHLFQKNIYVAIFNSSTLSPQIYWRQMPRWLKNNSEVITAYVYRCLAQPGLSEKDYQHFESLIRSCLKHTWSAELLRCYRRLPIKLPANRQLSILGAWLNKHGPQAEIFLSLGKLCAKQRLWGRAKEYFEQCLALGPFPEAADEYAKLLLELGENNQALLIYQQSVQAMIKD